MKNALLITLLAPFAAVAAPSVELCDFYKDQVESKRQSNRIYV
jgi:hypothetical protein